MPLPDLPRIVRVAVTGSFQAEEWANIFHFAWKDPGTSPDATQLAALVADLAAATTNAKSLINLYERTDSNNTVTLIEARTQDATTPIAASANVSWVGLLTGGDVPAMVAQVIQWRTAIASRRFRGRSFLPGVNTSMLDATDTDRFAAAIADATTAAAQAFVTAWAGDANWEFIVFSGAAAEAGETVVGFPITTATTRRIVGVQRRRRPALS